MSDPFKRTRLEQNTNSASHSEQTPFLPPIRTSDTSVTTIQPTSPHSMLQSRPGQLSPESFYNGEVAEVCDVTDNLNRAEESPCNSCNSNMLESAHEPPTELEPPAAVTNNETTAPVDSELEAELDRWGLDDELKANIRAMTPNTRREIINDIVREQQILHASHYVYNNDNNSSNNRESNFGPVPFFGSPIERYNFANIGFPELFANQHSFPPLPHVQEFYDGSTNETNTSTSVSETSHNNNNNVNNSRRPRYPTSHGPHNGNNNNNNVIEVDEDHDGEAEPLHSYEVSVGSSSDSEAEGRSTGRRAYNHHEELEVDDTNEEELLEREEERLQQPQQDRAPRRNRRGHRSHLDDDEDDVQFENFMRSAFDVMQPNPTSQNRNRPEREQPRPRRTMIWRRVGPSGYTSNNNTTTSTNANATSTNTMSDFQNTTSNNNSNRYANRWESSAASNPALLLFQLLNGLHSGGIGGNNNNRQVDFQNLLTVLAESEAQNEYGLLERDVDDMSYEELLELEERMGKVSRGLAPEQIRSVLTEVTHLPSKERCAICLEDCIPEAMTNTVSASNDIKNDHEKCNDSNNNKTVGTTNNSLPNIAKKTTGKDKEPSKRSHRIIAKSNDKTNNNTTTTSTTNSNNVANGSVRLSSNTTQDEKRNKNENTTENSSPSSSSDSTKCVQIISCGHVFHKHCIEQWLRINKTCPVCNQEIPI